MATASSSIATVIASLEPFSTALAAFTSDWRSLDSHLAAIDSSLTSRIAALPPSPPRPPEPEPEPEPDPDTEASPEESELWRLCAAMDGVGLRAYLIAHRSEFNDPTRALDAAILAAPDPGLLVLGAAAGLCPSLAQGEKNVDVKVARRVFVDLLDRLRELGVKPSRTARAEALSVAVKWQRNLQNRKKKKKQAMSKVTHAFSILVGAFGLVEDVGGAGEVLELVVLVSRQDVIEKVLVGLGLDLDEHVPVLIKKMKSEGRQLEAVKFIQALNLVHKYPLLPILRSYMNDAAKAGNQIRKMGNNFEASQDAASAKEQALLQELQKFIKEQKLEEVPILEEVEKRIAQLEQHDKERKRTASAAAAASAAASEVSKKIVQQQQQLPAKRLRVAENSVLVPLGQHIHPVGIQNQLVVLSQNIHPVGMQNQFRATLSQDSMPVVIQSSQQVAAGHHPVAIQSQAPPVSSVQPHLIASAAAATSAAASEVSKKILQQQQLPAKQPQVAENSVLVPPGQHIHPVGIQNQLVVLTQNIHPGGMQNQFRAALGQDSMPAVIQRSQQVAAGHHPVAIQSQAPPVSSVQPHGGLANYYGLTSSRHQYESLAAGPSGPGYPMPSRSQLYSADPLAVASRTSDRKSCSYNYSLSNMSTYDP